MEENTNQLEESQANEELDPEPKKRTGLWIGLGIGLVVLLAGAAFMGARMLRQQTVAGGQDPIILEGGNGEFIQSVSINIEPSDKLPPTEPEASGIFDHREDNSIFVSSGNDVFVFASEQGELTIDTGNEGSADGSVEVVISRETELYVDATMSNANINESETNISIPQVLEPGDIEEIGENSFISAWGERRGDRLIAEVVVYSNPFENIRP